MGFESTDGAAELIDELALRRNRIRTIYERYFAREQTAPSR
jgi:hypothetical protein